MANKSLCEETIEFLLLGEKEIPERLKEHISCCENCKTEHEKILRMQSLVMASKPDCPNLKEAVLEKITGEQIKIEKPKARRHFPIGTLSAAAAILVVYISIYGSDLSSFVFENENDAVMYDAVDEEIITETETENVKALYKAKSADENLMSGAGVPSKTSATQNMVFDKMDCVAFDDIAVIEEAVPEAQESDAKALFEEYSESYPDRISIDDIEQLGWDIYSEFVLSICDAESEYTLENFLKFAQE